MFNINIYQTYKISEIIKPCYKSYDSDDDNWFKNDEYSDEYELNGVNLINKIVKKLTMKDFSDCEINNTLNVVDKKVQEILNLRISIFNPMDGTGTEYIYYIKPIEKEGNNNE